MKFAVDKNTRVKILLCGIAQVFVFLENLLEAVTDVIEIMIGSIFMSIDFVLHLSLTGRDGNASHNVEEIRTDSSIILEKTS